MAIEAKYGQVTTEHGDIPADELVFLLRAQDAAVLDTLEHYLAACRRINSPSSHLTGIEQVIERFETWQADHPEMVKTPGTQRPA